MATLVLNLFMFNAQADDTDFRTWMNWNVSYNATDLYYLYQKQHDKAYNITGIDINFKF